MEHWFDDVSKTVAGGLSRRAALRRIGATLAGALLASVAGQRAAAREGDNGNSACAHFCQELPPGKARGRCVSEAAQGDPAGFCARCAANVGRICGDVRRRVCCDPTQGEVCCPTQARCLSCTRPRIPDAANCTCGCPLGSRECGENCCTALQECCRGQCRSACAPTERRNPETCACEPFLAFCAIGGTCPPGQRPNIPRCPDFPPDPQGRRCYCFTVAEGGPGVCARDIADCDEATRCVTSANCPPGHVCAVSTCCGDFGVCLTPCTPSAPAQVTSVAQVTSATPVADRGAGRGRTASGQPPLPGSRTRTSQADGEEALQEFP